MLLVNQRRGWTCCRLFQRPVEQWIEVENRPISSQWRKSLCNTCSIQRNSWPRDGRCFLWLEIFMSNLPAITYVISASVCLEFGLMNQSDSWLQTAETDCVNSSRKSLLEGCYIDLLWSWAPGLEIGQEKRPGKSKQPRLHGRKSLIGDSLYWHDIFPPNCWGQRRTKFM